MSYNREVQAAFEVEYRARGKLEAQLPADGPDPDLEAADLDQNL